MRCFLILTLTVALLLCGISAPAEAPETCTYTVVNATGEPVTELYITDNHTGQKSENYAGEGLADGACVEITGSDREDYEVTLSFTTESGFEGIFPTLHFETVTISLLIPADANTGATPISFSMDQPTNANANDTYKEDIEMMFYRCEHCGNIIVYVNDSGVRCSCCGEEMTPIVPNTTDAAGEKHVPVIDQNGATVTVKVGSVEHPMLEEHYIEWIMIETKEGRQRKALKPGDKSVATFALTEGDTVIAAYAYCNLHGLWKSEQGQ